MLEKVFKRNICRYPKSPVILNCNYIFYLFNTTVSRKINNIAQSDDFIRLYCYLLLHFLIMIYLSHICPLHEIYIFIIDI